ncbi:hypothetical protein [Qipengyuania atrilutea]|nr:hypothetical protein [Actirhodobacter atriluteus]
MHQPVERKDVFKRGYVFRSAVTGRYVTRAYALLFPDKTMKQRVR